ncbi:hypothetical protein BD408DRAFT_362091 [Parasitella parasitica]|nr:hypothetical protein BD408DRAFT_362091 [Parasitella parasitica]
MATIYHEYGPGDETYICPQRSQIRRDSADVQATVRRLSDSEMRRESENRRRSEVMNERVSVLGSVQSMREGKLPSNEQLDKVINRLLSSKSIETNKHHMSADGQLLLKDFQELLLTFQRALQTKNRDELFQSMIYHVRRSEATLADNTERGIEGDIQRKEQAKGDAKTGAKAILNIAKLFLFNAQFRGVLEQILNIAQQTLGSVLQQSGKAIGDNANSGTGARSSFLDSATSEETGKNGQALSNDKGKVKDSVRNAVASVAGGALGGGASHLASKHDYKTDGSNHKSFPKDTNSHLPNDHQDFMMHRFVDSESSAPVTDDAGHTLDQDIEHGAVPHTNSATPQTKQVFSNNQSTIQPATNTTERSAPIVPQHQMFLTNPTEGKQASAISSPTANDLKRSESPSSFTDMGKVGGSGGHRMGVNESNVNEAQLPSSDSTASATAGTTTTGAAAAGSLGMAGYLFNKQDVRSESPSSFADSGAIGNMDHSEFKHEQFYGNHMGVYDSAMNRPKNSLDLNSASSTANGDLDLRQKLGAAVPKYAPGAKPARDEFIENRFETLSGGGNAFVHKRLDAAMPHSAQAGTPQPMSSVGTDGYVPHQQSRNMLPDLNRSSQDNNADFLQMRLDKQVVPLIENQTLSPKSHISAGAGYHLNQENHTVSAKEIVETLRRPNASDTGSHVKDQVKAHAQSFPGQHVMDKIKHSSAPGGALVNPHGQTNDSRDQANVFTTAHSDKYDAVVAGTAGLMTASATHRAAIDGSEERFTDSTPRAGNSVPSSRRKRSSFHEPHEYIGVDGQRHMDEGSNTRSILSNKEAVRRLSSGDEVDVNAHPIKSNSKIGTASVTLGAGTGTAVGAATDSRQSQQDANQMSNEDDQICASKIVNKMKQKMGIDSQAGENTDRQEEQDSISASEIITNLKEILTTVQKNSEYQEAMSTLMTLFGTWGQRLKTGQMDRRRSSAVPIPEQNEYYRNTAAHEAKTIIEDWAQGKSLDPLLRQFSEISTKLKQDDNLNNLIHKITVYVQRMLQEPGYLSGNESTEEGNKLVNEVRHSALEDYKPQVKSMIQESNGIIKSVSDDPLSQKISGKIRNIHDHLWYDSNGHAAFKPHLLNDMRITLIPALIEQIKFVPLPQIIYSDKQFEIAIENMVLQGDTLMPDIFEVKADDYLRFSPKANANFTNSQSIHVHMTGIQTIMEDVVFYYRRKSGFPKMSDSGVISVATDGAGLRVSLRIVSSSIDQKHTFRIDQCHCHIDKLNIKVNHSKHNILYKVLNPMMTGIIKHQMCKAIENKLIATFEKGDAKITKHLVAKKLSQETSIQDARRPGLFSHLISVLNQKVSSI